MMDEHDRKIHRIINDAVEEDVLKASRHGMRYAIVALTLIAAMVAVFAGMAYYRYGELKKTEALVKDYEQIMEKQRQEAAALNDAIESLKALRVQAELLPLSNVSIRKTGDTMRISGTIKNTGSRGIDDITLMAYMLDKHGTVLKTAEATARSSDGRPLYRGQRRRFVFEAENPEGASQVIVLITGIEFE